MVGSTAIGEKLDPESFLGMMSEFYNAMRAAVEHHGGTVEKFIGDAVMAVFGVPQLHEDDALRALRAAVEMQRGLARLNERLQRDLGVEIQTRTGVNTGEVLAGAVQMRDAIVLGDAVNTAARLEQAASPGQILMGETTYQLVREMIEAESVEALALKGKADAVPAHRFVSFKDIEAWSKPEGSPFLSRRLELAYLETVYERAVEEHAAYRVTIVGGAGVGKSRLALEFAELARRKADVVFGRCLPYGNGITYWPVREALLSALDIRADALPSEIEAAINGVLEQDDSAARIARDVATLFGVGDEAIQAEELQWAVRKLLESLARERPLVVVFEDVHWAEPTFLDLVDHIVRWSREVPMLILCLGRPELFDLREEWQTERKRSDALVLDPLSDAACEQLIQTLVPGLDEHLRSRIVAAAAGLPLFVHSMVSMLIDQKLLTRRGDVWEATGELGDVIVPPTVQAVLSARLDRLNADERSLIERAALVGERFGMDDLGVLADPDDADPRILLESLTRKDLIRPAGDEEAQAVSFRFSHMLIRDIAYREMPKKVRAELHERFAEWIDRQAEVTRAYDEILGYHLEQAFRLRTELRPTDPRSAVLAARAASVLKKVGRRAFARLDMSAARGLLSRAIELLPADDEDRLFLMADLARTRMFTAELDEANATVAEGLELARARGDERAEHMLKIRGDQIIVATQPEARLREALANADDAVRYFDSTDDAEGLANSLLWASSLRFWVGEAGVAIDGFERALNYSQDRPALTSTILNFEAAALIWGPSHAAEIERWAADVLSACAGAPMAEAAALMARAYARALNGDAPGARQLATRARSIHADMGLVAHLARTESVLGLIELLVNDLSAAERSLHRAYEVLEEAHESGFLSTVASILADVLCEQGKYPEAATMAQRAIELSAPDDVDPMTRSKSVLAMVSARRGDAEAAIAQARAAVDGCSDTDLMMIRADALRRLGEVLREAGRDHDAVAVFSDALAAYERKGNVVMAARVHRYLGDDGSPLEAAP